MPSPAELRRNVAYLKDEIASRVRRKGGKDRVSMLENEKARYYLLCSQVEEATRNVVHGLERTITQKAIDCSKIIADARKDLATIACYVEDGAQRKLIEAYSRTMNATDSEKLNAIAQAKEGYSRDVWYRTMSIEN